MNVVTQTTTSYDEALDPVLEIKSGDTVIFDAPDCWGNQLRDESVLKGDLYRQGLAMNPCCGPVAVAGAEPGDTVKITVQGIDVADTGRLAIYREEFGVLSRYLDRDQTVVVPVKDGVITLHDKFSIKANPMLGVIAVTPAGDPQGTLLSGRYGGNIDCNLVTRGTVVYLPVLVPGAKIITGDVHAIQGDGEVLASLEVAARITLKVELIKGRQEQWPVLETDDAWYVITSGLTADEANALALEAMADFLTRRGRNSNLEWLTLMGLVGDAELCKVVDTFKTSRFGMQKTYTESLAF